MNAIAKKNAVSLSAADLPSVGPANDLRFPRVAADLDPFTRCYRRHSRQLRAACAQYVGRGDVDDLVQDVWLVAAQHPAKLAQSDSRTLSWLIGIAKRCAPSYRTVELSTVPLDVLLARESGDDLDGRAIHEDVTELRAGLWGKDD